MSSLGNTSVVFDLDGTLVDSEPNYFEASRQTLAEHGVPDFTWEEHESYVGISTHETLEMLRQKYGIEAPVDVLLTELNTRYLARAHASTPVYPQMRQLVERLHAAGVPMAVASGSSSQAIAAVLAGTGLNAHLRVHVSADEVAHGKPAPDIFLEAARRMGAMPVHCTVIEDAVPGAAAAYAAGMRCIAVPYVTSQAGDPGFATAELLFRGGHREFTAAAAYDWLARTAARDASGTPYPLDG
ncbi:HAD family phosphatase [Streptomyces sp. NPDC046821]|uniref:HAD family hydrolase n=1 Tax=Streptomyces sp. NPDC046821 TaxID=3154702 RepID=UPI0033C8AE04